MEIKAIEEKHSSNDIFTLIEGALKANDSVNSFVRNMLDRVVDGVDSYILKDLYQKNMKLRPELYNLIENIDVINDVDYLDFGLLHRELVDYCEKATKLYVTGNENLATLKINVVEMIDLLSGFFALLSSLSRFSQKTENYIKYSEAKKKEITKYYSDSKIASDEIRKELESLNAILSRAKEQKNKIDDLEKEYRKSLIQMEVDENKYNERNAVIDKAHDIAKEYLGDFTEFQKEYNAIQKKYVQLEVMLSKLDGSTKQINEALELRMNEIDLIITKANDALGSSASVALGGHFKTQYDDSKTGAFWWLVFAAFFLIGAIYMCINAVAPLTQTKQDSNGSEIYYIISRVAIAPLFLLGAWFCANQYVKQKNIIEDYAYKKVLSLSLLSIKAEIEKTGEANTTEFIRALQGEIMKSPLDALDRKHLRNETRILKKVHSEVLKDLVKGITKTNTKNKNKEKMQ